MQPEHRRVPCAMPASGAPRPLHPRAHCNAPRANLPTQTGLSREAVADRVFRTGMRPRFPPTAPPAFVAVCEECWTTDPTRRPAFSEITARLEAFMGSLLSSATAPALHGAAAAAASAAPAACAATAW
jgi:hypothetical protein